MRTLQSLLLAGLLAVPAQGAAPRLLASDVITSVLVDGGKQVLYYDSAAEFSLLDIASGASRPWRMDAVLEATGFRLPRGDAGYPNLAASPDGSTVALARYVEFDSSDPAQDYPNSAYLLMLSRADGSGARLAALVEPTDGGPRLDFTPGGRHLIGPWFYDCAPTPAGYEAWYAGLADAAEITDSSQLINALDIQTGELVHLPALADTEWGVDKSPYSGWYTFEAMDTPERHFGSLGGPATGLQASWLPDEADGFFLRSTWVGPEELLLEGEQGQRLVNVRGESWSAPPGHWMFYARLPDGRSFFSRDGGVSIELGRVDWRSGTVAAAQARPDLAHFALPAALGEWPARVDSWLPLPDGRGVLVNTPGVDGGGLYFVTAD